MNTQKMMREKWNPKEKRWMEKRSDTNNKTSTSQMHANTIWCWRFFLFSQSRFFCLYSFALIRSPLLDIFISRQIFHATFARSIFYVLVLLLSAFFHTIIHSLCFFRCLSLPNAVSRFHSFFVANAPLCARSLDAEQQTVQFSHRHSSLLTPFLRQHETFSRLPLNSGLECSCVPCAWLVRQNIFLLIFCVSIFHFERATVLWYQNWHTAFSFTVKLSKCTRYYPLSLHSIQSNWVLTNHRFAEIFVFLFITTCKTHR